MIVHVSKDITSENIKATEKILIDNGIEKDEASTVLQAIGYALIDVELYPKEKIGKEPIYLYTYDGKFKVDITKAKMLGDVNRDKGIDRQGDRTQLWVSESGRYFTGSCLDFYIESSKIILLTDDAARAWVIRYYGGHELNRFGFDDAEYL